MGGVTPPKNPDIAKVGQLEKVGQNEKGITFLKDENSFKLKVVA